MLRQTRYINLAFRPPDFSGKSPMGALPPAALLSSATHPSSRMLGYPTVFIAQMFRVNGHFHARTMSALRYLLLFTPLLFSFFGPALPSCFAQQAPLHSGKAGNVEIWSRGPQQKRGDLFIADDDVDIHYGDQRLQADHVEYNQTTSESYARGHVRFDYNNEHLEADEAHYNVSTGHGTFTNVRGTVKMERRANPLILVSQNPLHFEAPEVERLAEDIYLVNHGWITICDPQHPTWQFYSQHARIRLNKTVALVSANFRLFRVPLGWLPYATAPAGEKIRQSGFLLPVIAQSSSKGFVLGDALYLAPRPWFDATAGAELLTKRGSAERGEFRARPFENTSIRYTYYGVIDRGINEPGPNDTTVLEKQGGHQQQLEAQSLLPDGWRAVTDLNELSSLTFRLAFADTFGDAITSEVRSATFLTNNFRGFSLNFASLADKTFLSIPITSTTTGVTTPAVSVSLRDAPEVRFGSVEQAPWENLPVYFSFDAFADALHRQDDTPLNTPSFVPRIEFAPTVTLPLHLGSWLGVTTSATFRTTYYGDSLNSAAQLSTQSITRNTGELTVDLRLPTLERFFDRASLDKNKPRKRYKHTIEPTIVYHYVGGVTNFADFIRFDSDATLTNTNQVEYGVTQRLFVKTGDDQPKELITWSILQDHYFDPTFGGAILDGQRNVFAAMDSISPFAFAFGPRNWSPIISDIKITPSGPYDVEQILQYDPQIQRLVTVGTLLKIKPYSEFFATVAYFRLNDNPVQADLPAIPPPDFVPFVQPLSNQVRALMGYGNLTRKGFNFTTGISYDFTNQILQSQLVQVSYNGDCCGLALEYRRINLGQVRTENRFTATFIIANIGSFGNLRRQEKIF
ncbi:MAG TPA: LPS assembly protein LptD [Candidatus Acidoferrum sp.]|nr:LPS assembly protein LptD [Candidatus Acidoferrum sp.]